MATFDEQTLNNILAEIAALKSELRNLAVRDTSIQALDEVAEEIGDLEYRVVNENGVLRQIMSAINLEEEFGISAHRATFGTDGVTPTIWEDADNGRLNAARGTVQLAETGLIISDSGAQIVIGGVYLVSYIGNDGSELKLVSVTPDGAATNLQENGNLETGDTTGWSPGTWAISTVDPYEGSYCIHTSTDGDLLTSADDLPLTEGDSYMLEVAIKRTGSAYIVFPASILMDTPSFGVEPDKWGVVRSFFTVPVGTTSVKLRFQKYGTGTVYLDSIKLIHINSFASIEIGNGQIITQDIVADKLTLSDHIRMTPINPPTADNVSNCIYGNIKTDTPYYAGRTNYLGGRHASLLGYPIGIGKRGWGMVAHNGLNGIGCTVGLQGTWAIVQSSVTGIIYSRGTHASLVYGVFPDVDIMNISLGEIYVNTTVWLIGDNSSAISNMTANLILTNSSGTVYAKIAQNGTSGWTLTTNIDGTVRSVNFGLATAYKEEWRLEMRLDPVEKYIYAVATKLATSSALDGNQYKTSLPVPNSWSTTLLRPYVSCNITSGTRYLGIASGYIELP